MKYPDALLNGWGTCKLIFSRNLVEAGGKLRSRVECLFDATVEAGGYAQLWAIVAK